MAVVGGLFSEDLREGGFDFCSALFAFAFSQFSMHFSQFKNMSCGQALADLCYLILMDYGKAIGPRPVLSCQQAYQGRQVAMALMSPGTVMYTMAALSTRVGALLIALAP